MTTPDAGATVRVRRHLRLLAILLLLLAHAALVSHCAVELQGAARPSFTRGARMAQAAPETTAIAAAKVTRALTDTAAPAAPSAADRRSAAPGWGRA